MAYSCCKWALRFGFAGVNSPQQLSWGDSPSYFVWCLSFLCTMKVHLVIILVGLVALFGNQMVKMYIHWLSIKELLNGFSLRSFGGICQHNCSGNGMLDDLHRTFPKSFSFYMGLRWFIGIWSGPSKAEPACTILHMPRHRALTCGITCELAYWFGYTNCHRNYCCLGIDEDLSFTRFIDLTSFNISNWK